MMHNVYSAFQILAWQLQAVAVVLMTLAGWQRSWRLLYWIQVVQLAQLNVGLYLWLTRSSIYTAFREEGFWPNTALEFLIIWYCGREFSKGNKQLLWVGIMCAVHTQARYIHHESYDIHPSLGWEYAVMEFANLGILIAILWALYCQCGNHPQGAVDERTSEAEAAPEY